jgi:hypothetical protein
MWKLGKNMGYVKQAFVKKALEFFGTSFDK